MRCDAGVCDGLNQAEKENVNWYAALSSVARKRQKAELVELMTPGSAKRRRQSLSFPLANDAAPVSEVMMNYFW